MKSKGPAIGALGEHPRTLPYSKMSSNVHTELQMSLPRAKNVEEADFEFRLPVVPTEPYQNREKCIFGATKK